MCPYEIFEHTADVGLRITAADLNTLFAEAGRGFFGLMVENLQEVQPMQQITIELQASDLEALLLDWLSELLFRFETEYLVLKDFEVQVAGAEPGTAAKAARDLAPGDSPGAKYSEEGRLAPALSSRKLAVSLRAVARGEPLDPQRHDLHLNVKAVTYHNLKVERTADGWQAEVILDI